MSWLGSMGGFEQTQVDGDDEKIIGYVSEDPFEVRRQRTPHFWDPRLMPLAISAAPFLEPHLACPLHPRLPPWLAGKRPPRFAHLPPPNPTQPHARAFTKRAITTDRAAP